MARKGLIVILCCIIIAGVFFAAKSIYMMKVSAEWGSKGFIVWPSSYYIATNDGNPGVLQVSLFNIGNVKDDKLKDKNNSCYLVDENGNEVKAAKLEIENSKKDRFFTSYYMYATIPKMKPSKYTFDKIIIRNSLKQSIYEFKFGNAIVDYQDNVQKENNKNGVSVGNIEIVPADKNSFSIEIVNNSNQKIKVKEITFESKDISYKGLENPQVINVNSKKDIRVFFENNALQKFINLRPMIIYEQGDKSIEYKLIPSEVYHASTYITYFDPPTQAQLKEYAKSLK